ncbi:MAG: hypothetical protein KDI50_09785 [Candidatus Competibacteraceae bacterium]|nr:hypothetical protein [Candidatus Competibacteraceae bacterium]
MLGDLPWICRGRRTTFFLEGPALDDESCGLSHRQARWLSPAGVRGISHESVGSLIADGSLQVQYFPGGDGVRALADLLDKLVGLSVNGAALPMCPGGVAWTRCDAGQFVFGHERLTLACGLIATGF